MMNPFGERARGRKYLAKAASGAHSRGCRTCRWVLNLYPTLEALDPEDGALFREHLKSVHGLEEEIRP